MSAGGNDLAQTVKVMDLQNSKQRYESSVVKFARLCTNPVVYDRVTG